MDDSKAISALKLGIVLTAIFFIMELVGGYVSGSLSLLSDAGHMFRDVLALVLSLLAINLAMRFPTGGKTFGYHRAEVLAALLNGIMLLVISIWILWEAYHRIRDPLEIDTGIMFVVALIGLLINAIIVWKLHGSHDLNVRSAFLHVLTDLLSSIAVIIASVIIFFTGLTVVDPILSILIAVFILVSSGKLIWDSIYILLEFTPKNVDVDKVIEDVESLEGVDGIHNMHIWTLCSNINVIDAHVYTEEKDMEKVEIIKERTKELLKEHNISHVTLEFECLECRKNDKVCVLEHC